MLYIICTIIALAIIIWLVKILGRFIAMIFKGIFYLFYGILYCVIAGPAIVCTKIFYVITKIFFLQGFIYYLLALGSIPSLIYLLGFHIPYSKKEKFIDEKNFFKNNRKERNNVIAMSFFLSLESYLLFYIHFKIMELYSIFIISGLSFTIISFIYIIIKCNEWKNKNKNFYESCIEWKKWTLSKSDIIFDMQIEEQLISMTDDISNADKNKNIFTIYEMPYGRTTAFISYFNKNLDDEEPIYFSPTMSSDENELREYGTLITTKGIYISVQNQDDIEIPFMGLWSTDISEDKCFFNYGIVDDEYKVVEVDSDDSTINIKEICDFTQSINTISLSMLHDNIKNGIDEAFDSYENTIAEITESERKFNDEQKLSSISKSSELGGIGAGLEQNAHIYNDEVKYLMNGARGGGYAAEYGNNAIDRITGNNVKNMAQDLENGRQKLHGADRNVNGINIQTKYYKSAPESIGAAFEHKQAIYLNEDGTMMQIEVPRDQYNQAIQEMQKRIRNGQVPNETNPDNAKNYVRKGHFTYFQANNIALAGSIEGITVDIAQGVVCSLPGAGITAALTFATAVWNGDDIKEAAKRSTLSGLKVMGKCAAIYTITMQLSRDKIINIFAPKVLVGENGKKVVKSFASINNPIFAAAEKAAGKISTSSVAQSKIGKSLNLDKINGRQLIGGTVTAAIVYGPDVCKAFQGKISGKQLIKNSTVNTAGLIGAALGTAIPIPIVGSMIGGAIGSFVAKKVMDNFIEDDAVMMFRIMREEFLDIVMLYSFNKEEFDKILSMTIGNSNMSSILQKMYQSETPKEFADALITAQVQEILAERPRITSSMLEEGVTLMLEDKSVA
ncbi:hypothetical protein H0R90_11025 [Treponema putidum]|uniref:hypothetical protein n=1 Tax=Treponema putidum TaxID=221027 RepID=UPI0004F86821|nr:hypothetical protein [Treponema putidum]AIN93406.1 hypothetical protein JO40_04155 [Treponema putidum]TWI74476.1 hypothetical protein JM98_02103 [Treponema putidum]